MKHQDKFKIYLSHQIRGPKGDDATDEEIQSNIELYKAIGQELKAYFIDWEKMDGFPKIELYVPADHDEFVLISYQRGYLTETEILSTDCGIIDTCDLVIMFSNYRSHGMQVEEAYAAKEGIAIYQMPRLSDMTIEALKFCIHLLITAED